MGGILCHVTVTYWDVNAWGTDFAGAVPLSVFDHFQVGFLRDFEENFKRGL
jgi:hypothetical protein